MSICRVLPDIKERLQKVIDDPHFGNRERLLAKSSLQRICEHENQINSHWTQMADSALLAETRNEVITSQIARDIGDFLKRHRD